MDVSAVDGVGTAIYTHYNADYKAHAKNTIHSGGKRSSYLMVPVIPAK